MVFKATKYIPITGKDLLSWCFDDIPYDWDKPIYVDPNDPSRTISARQAKLIIRKLVAGFHAAGLKAGDCVCLNSFNDIQYSMVFLGVVAAGGVFTGSNPGCTPFELTHHLKASDAKFLIFEPELIDTSLAAAKKCGIPNSKLWIFDVLGQALPSGFRSWQQLLQHGETDWIRFDNHERSEETMIARFFSSGTTGLPKAVMWSHKNLIAEHTLAHEPTVKQIERRRIVCTPVFHGASAPTAHTSALRSGTVTYIMRRFELEGFLSIVDKHKITDFIVVPPIVVAIVMSPLTAKYSLKSVTTAMCGAAALDAGVQARFRQLISPEGSISNVWGMTETSCIATMFYHPEDDITGSVGRLLPNMDAKLIDEEGREITTYDTEGEFCVRGPLVTKGYFNSPAANASSYHNGFFKTGDVMYCSSKTNTWFIVDRRKELIKVRGFQVAPAEIEGVLLGHPQIVDAAVIGVTFLEEPDVERPRAYVVRRTGKEGLSLGEGDVKAYCKEKLSGYKSLTGGVRFVDLIPKTASGKILKRILRDQAKTELQNERPRL
ncbi:hypothetical protein B0O99DRAFT_696168 [Bisporella sp. PMI_857]|nr:hypothetical protein B0O99DRAFT_696168 [Bisporella sp. PMI_857]